MLAAYISDRSNPRYVLMFGCVLVGVTGLLLAPMLGSGSLLVIWAFLSFALFGMGFCLRPPWGLGCPAYSRPGSDIPGHRCPSMSAAYWAAALPPSSPKALVIKGGLVWVGVYLTRRRVGQSSCAACFAKQKFFACERS